MEIQKKKILVVDSHPVFLRLMAEFLSELGHETICANDVFGCLDALVEMTPDVIFIDLIMPRVGGDDLCRIIRNMDNLRHCYLVIVSGVALEQPLDCQEIGADALIAKGPFDEMRLHILQILRDSEKPRHHSLTIPAFQGGENLHSRHVSRELLKNNQHLRVILESMSQGIIELLGNRIAYINPKASSFLGQPRENLLGRHIAETFPQPLLDAIAAASQPPAETAPMQLNGLQLTLEQFAITNTPPNVILMLSDITERKQMEAVIEAANLTKNLGYVFSGIRHEIGNPLNSIKMALSVLQRNLAEYDRETIALFLDRSLQEVTRLEYLLKALKNYSLFEKPVMQKLPVASFITNFIALIRNDFENNLIKIHHILPDDDLLILADSRALHHIMLNLITNAADALNGGNKPQIIVSARQAGNRVEIKVDDNGKGISEADQQNLFKPFFTKKATGTGLGLVIVKKMLLAMNGKIEIESYQGMGTTVTLTLPGIVR